MITLENKIALVTGASRGIGKAIAQSLAKQGAYVIGTATTITHAQLINDYLNADGLSGKGKVLDLTDKSSLDTLMTQLAQDSEMPSILVNNAAITSDNLLLRMDDEDWYKVIETNLNAVFHLTKSCLKSMFRARWGRIITLSSVVAASGNAGQANYAAAKAALIGFSKSVAQEVASRHITVNVVAPGFIDTDMTRKLPDLVKEHMLKRIPMKRFGEAQEVAQVVSFLASQGASYLTGETIHVNGGLYMD